MPWWDAQSHADRRPLLLTRGRLKTALRGWFETQGFTEIEAGALVASPGNETHLHAFETSLTGPDAQIRPLYLHTSPEFAAKKLLAAGETRIFDFARVFRNRERGRLHAPEFTMLEWYRAREDYEKGIEDALALLWLAADVAGAERLRHRGLECDPHAPAQRLTVAQAFTHLAGIDLLATLSDSGMGDADQLRVRARRGGIDVADDDDWSDTFAKILTLRVEPRLGVGQPTILYEYPVCEAALARVSPGDARVAERFELYACGVELANGFGELTDVAEQRARFETEMARKARIYGIRYPLDEELLAALAHMPPASGVALGFDRLVMLAIGAPNIDSVLWTPLPE
ncbi:MAG TPA: EF-P lysine aminoacylase EpmA [Rhizomicrobium sp.]|nr:EF-P lysine aminoacylase EpmA [Rhizomicrobium sp.]